MAIVGKQTSTGVRRSGESSRHTFAGGWRDSLVKRAPAVRYPRAPTRNGVAGSPRIGVQSRYAKPSRRGTPPAARSRSEANTQHPATTCGSRAHGIDRDGGPTTTNPRHYLTSRSQTHQKQTRRPSLSYDSRHQYEPFPIVSANQDTNNFRIPFFNLPLHTPGHFLRFASMYKHSDIKKRWV